MTQTPSDERKAMLQKYSRMVIDSYPNVAEAFIFGLLDKVTSEAQQTIAPVDEQAIHDSMRGRDFDFNTTTPIEVYTEGFRAGKATAQQTIADLAAKLDGAKKTPMEVYPFINPSSFGCSRSHPHENMDEVCKLKTEHAKKVNEMQCEILQLREQLSASEAKRVELCTRIRGVMEYIPNSEAKWHLDYFLTTEGE